MRTYIGIDPGVNGGVAVITGARVVLFAKRMPATGRDLLDALERYGVRSPYTSTAILERVGPSPVMSRASAFVFGRMVEQARMALLGNRISFDEVTAQKWQAAIGARTGGVIGRRRPDKNVTKRKAQALFPGIAVTHAIADALLLAEYCRRVNGGTTR